MLHTKFRGTRPAGSGEQEQSSRTPVVAITGHNTLIGKKEKWANKGTDKQFVAECFIHSTACYI